MAQGDIVTTVVKTHKGRTIVINNDMQLPRPYDNRWVIQGTLGVYHEERGCIYLHGKSPEFQVYEPFGPYQEKYEHAWWKNINDEAPGIGHGGPTISSCASLCGQCGTGRRRRWTSTTRS
jgi:hypothetical protein